MVEWNSHVDFFVGALMFLQNMFVSYLDSYFGFFYSFIISFLML